MVQNLGATIGIALAVLVGFVFLGVMFYRIQAESEDIARELAEGAELEAQAVSSPELLRLALARYQSVAKRDPNNPQAVEGLARVAKAIQAFGDGGLEQAVERDIRVALEVIRDPARVGAASVVCDLLIAHYGSHHRARAARAEWRWRTGDPEGAMADLEALPPSPGTTAMRRLRVLCLVASDRAVDAEVVAGDPGPGPISPVEMAAARLAQGNRAECRQWLQQVLSPTAESYWVTALLEVREQGYRAAIASFDACSALDPTFIPARLAAIRGLREGGRHAEAVDRAAKIVEMLPRLPAPRISLAASYAAGGNTVAACREMDRVLRMADAPAWRVMRGTWLLQSGDPRGVADLARLAR
jgi:tetratricopeptide (TPR) repeat protein